MGPITLTVSSVCTQAHFLYSRHSTGENPQELSGHLDSHRNLSIYQLYELGKISTLKSKFLLVCVWGGIDINIKFMMFPLREGSGLGFSYLEKTMPAEV